MHRTQVIWLLIVTTFIVSIYFCRAMLTPFIVSLAASYILYPVSTFLERRLHISRWLVALILVVFILSMLLTIILIIAPLIYHQTLAFIAIAPHYKNVIDHKIMYVITKYVPNIDPEYVEKIRAESLNLFITGFDNVVHFLGKIWSSGFVVIDIIWFIALVPFITFHMIKDWDRILFYAINTVPKSKQKLVRQVFLDIDYTIAKVIRGQFNICLLLSIYYTLALTVLKLNYSILLGVTTGVLSFIPIVGPLSGFIISIIVAYLQFNNATILIHVVAVYLIGVILDGVIISPSIIGRRIGLHPVWMIFSILLGWQLFGFTGTLLAVPLYAVAAVVVKNLLAFYYKSNLYEGQRSL